MRNFGRDKRIGVPSVEAVDVGDVPKIPDPFVDAQQIEVGGADEVDGRFVAVKESANVGDAFEFLFHGFVRVNGLGH